MKTCFSEGKRMKQFGTPRFLREPHPPPHSTKPPISEQFFHDSPLCSNLKNTKHPPPPYTHTHTHTLNFRGEETMALGSCINW